MKNIFKTFGMTAWQTIAMLILRLNSKRKPSLPTQRNSTGSRKHCYWNALNLKVGEILVRSNSLQRPEFYSISPDYGTHHLKRSYTLNPKQFWNDKKNNFPITPFCTLLARYMHKATFRPYKFIHPSTFSTPALQRVAG